MKISVKRFLSLTLVFIMVLSLIPVGTISTSAAGKMTLEELQLKFPHHKYWNHAGNPGASNSVNNQDGYTSTPCSVHGVVGTSQQTCNGFQPGSTQLSWQCMGYAEKLGYDFTGYNPRNNANGWYTYTSTSALDSLKAGDIVRYKNNGHSIFVTAVNGDTVTYTDCNGESSYLCRIRWGATISKSTLKSSFTHVRSAPYSPDSGTSLTKLTTFPTPIYAQTKATGKTTVYSYPNGSTITNKIYDTDLCTISAIYTNGWCKVTFPLDAGGTETGYVKTSVFFNPDYSTFKVTASKQITTYPRSNLSDSFGYVASGDTVYIIGHTSSAVQILYPLTGGGYKAGWVPISAVTYNIKYNSNGGTGSMSSSTVKYQNTFNLTANSFTKTGYTFSGWNAYRSSDKTWYCSSYGWKTASQITSNSYTKKTYTNSWSGTLNKSWMSGGKTGDTITFYAIWKANTLSTYFNANGGTISSDTYKLSNNLVYNISDNSKYVQTWTYNNKKTNGIVNIGTLGLSKTGHTFTGWGTKASGGTIFDQNDTELLPTTINSNLNTGSCSSTLYAIWQPNTLTIQYKANGGTVTSDSYSVTNGYISNKSDNSTKTHTWTYNSSRSNGLYNAKTFGLERDGYKFVGWSTTADGSSKIFDQDDVTIVPTDLTSTINSKSCTLDLYAIWEEDIAEAPTEKSTEAPTVDPTANITTEPTQTPTELEVVIGDVDGDGNVTIMDATQIQSYLAKAIIFTTKQEILADTDKDSKITVMDATMIQRFIAQLISGF